MANQTLSSTPRPRTVKQITDTKPFTQSSQAGMANPMGHPTRNLGKYAHTPKGRHTERKVGKPNQTGNFKPAGDLRENLHSSQKSVAGLDMGNSDVKSESIGPDLGPITTAPKAFTAKPNKKKQMKASKPSGTPFFGGY